MTETLAGIPLEQDYVELREAVGKVCADFPGEYWRGLEKNADYPTIAFDNTWRHDREHPGVHNDDKRMHYICVARCRD